MMAAGCAAGQGCRVLLLEKMDRCGRKLCLTGKGRCNLTNIKNWNEFADHVHTQSDFFRSAFWGFSNQAVMDFFASIGIETVKERGDRVFPACQDARKVADALVKWMKGQGVKLYVGARVNRLEYAEGRIQSLYYTKNGQTFGVKAGAYVLATGGCSYPATGSTGDGYVLAEAVGHTITDCFPSLTALMPEAYDPRLQGITLINVGLSLLVNGQSVREEFGELAFTDLGIEGPLGLRLSRQAVIALRSGAKVSLALNLKPALSCGQLKDRLQRDCISFGLEPLEIFLKHYLPRALIRPFINAMSLKPGEQARKLAPAQSERLLRGLRHWTFPVVRYGGFERAVVTAGGISLKEIQKKDMRSKIAKNLFFAGEVIDLDGDTGGYNLQIAFSTGMLAGKKTAETVAD